MPAERFDFPTPMDRSLRRCSIRHRHTAPYALIAALLNGLPGGHGCA